MEIVVGVMAQAPRAGRVMTRLGEQIGMERAARFYAGCLGWVLLRLEEAGCRRVLFYDPPGSEARLRRLYDLPEHVDMVAQQGTDLGERMYRALSYLNAAYDGPRLLIGSDAPDLPLTLIRRAAARLDTVDLVLGPASDGGYYLVGMNQPREALFTGMTWSRPDVLKRTLKRACERGLHVSLLSVWRDLDTLDDLEGWPAREI